MAVNASAARTDSPSRTSPPKKTTQTAGGKERRGPALGERDDATRPSARGRRFCGGRAGRCGSRRRRGARRCEGIGGQPPDGLGRCQRDDRAQRRRRPPLSVVHDRRRQHATVAVGGHVERAGDERPRAGRDRRRLARRRRRRRRGPRTAPSPARRARAAWASATPALASHLPSAAMASGAAARASSSPACTRSCQLPAVSVGGTHALTSASDQVAPAQPWSAA